MADGQDNAARYRYERSRNERAYNVPQTSDGGVEIRNGADIRAHLILATLWRG
jgi:hypothetical protein